MLGAELVNFMVYFLKYPGFVIINSIIFDSLPSVLFIKAVDHFYFIKIDNDSSTCAAWDISDFISLHSYLDVLDGGIEWDFDIIPWLSIAW